MLPLRVKLTIWYLALVSLVLIAFSAAIYVYLSHSLLGVIDKSLLHQAETLARNYQNNPLPVAPETGQPIGQANTTEIVPQYVQFINGEGVLVDEIKDSFGNSLPVNREILAIGTPQLDTLTINNGEQVRVATWPLHLPAEDRVESYIRVGQSLISLQQAEWRLLRLLAIALPIVLVLASFGGLLLADKALNPMEKVAQAARRIGASNLNERVIVPQAGDEISRLAALFNEMIERLEQAFERERRFTADASHELRTPLAVLRGEMEIALRKDRSIEEYKEVLSNSLEEIIRLSRLVEDLLTLARSESGELVLERTMVELDKMAAEICHYVTPLAQAKGLTLNYIAPSHPLNISADARRLRQLLLNLLDNAIKYTPAGGEVELSLQEDQGQVSIAVKDTGYGVAPTEQKLIFERFYRRNHTNTNNVGGFGLGLPICKWITEAHGGKLTVESEIGKGSQFCACFPAHSA